MMESKKVTRELVASLFPVRAKNSRKGDNGVVAVVGGSTFYHGAPFLAAVSAQRAGVDLVYLAVPRTISTPIRAFCPDIIVIPLPDAKLTTGSVDKLLKWLPRVDTVVFGPGLGKQKTDGMKKFAKEVVLSMKVKLLLDADALNREVVEICKGHDVTITPHAGEFLRVFGKELPSEYSERPEFVRKVAEESEVTILLKGPVDIISDGKESYSSSTGTPAMTVGGTGDVLAGLVGGFMALGLKTLDAAIVGAFCNGYAGEKVASRLGFHMTALDLVNELPLVLKDFDKLS